MMEEQDISGVDEFCLRCGYRTPPEVVLMDKVGGLNRTGARPLHKVTNGGEKYDTAKKGGVNAPT